MCVFSIGLQGGSDQSKKSGERERERERERSDKKGAFYPLSTNERTRKKKEKLKEEKGDIAHMHTWVGGPIQVYFA